MTGFGDEDLARLEALLAQPPYAERALQPDGVQGMIHALAIGPDAFPPDEQWIAVALDEDPAAPGEHDAELVDLLTRFAAKTREDIAAGAADAAALCAAPRPPRLSQLVRGLPRRGERGGERLVLLRRARGLRRAAGPDRTACRRPARGCPRAHDAPTSGASACSTPRRSCRRRWSACAPSGPIVREPPATVRRERRQGRPQRSLPLRQRQEVQAVPREGVRRLPATALEHWKRQTAEIRNALASNSPPTLSPPKLP